jgi:hypothetical protein
MASNARAARAARAFLCDLPRQCSAKADADLCTPEDLHPGVVQGTHVPAAICAASTAAAVAAAASRGCSAATHPAAADAALVAACVCPSAGADG